MSSDGIAYSINKNNITVGNLMSYMIFASEAQDFIDTNINSVREKIINGNDGTAYTDFLSAVKDFESQYYYFQTQEAFTGKDMYAQGLLNLLLANTAIKLVKDKVKNCKYVTDIYKATVSESPEHYDSLKYYILSGGDSSYLNSTFQDELDTYDILYKDSKEAIKITKKALTDDDLIDSSIIELGLDNLVYFAETNDCEYSEEIELIKDTYSYADTTFELIKSISSYSILGVASASYDLADKYIDEVKKIYTDVSNMDSGWYALTYYYLGLNNAETLDAMFDSQSGEIAFDAERWMNLSFDFNDTIQKELAIYYQKNALLNHIYKPSSDFRFYLYNICDTMINTSRIDCCEYREMLINYILAELNAMSGNTSVDLNVSVQANNSSLGTISGEGSYMFGSEATVSAIPAESSSFVAWKNVLNDSVVSTQPNYTFKVYSDTEIKAVFNDSSDKSITVPIITENPQSAIYYKGEKPEALTVSAFTNCGSQIYIDWYRSFSNTNEAGIYVCSGETFEPSTLQKGTQYYFAVLRSSDNSSNVQEESICVKSNVAEITVSDPLITGLNVSKMPNKTTSVLGESFNSTGMIVELQYSDNTSNQVSDYQIVYDFSSEGKKEVTITYLGLNNKITIDVVTVLNGTFTTGVNWLLDTTTKVLNIYGQNSIPGYAYLTWNNYYKYIEELIIEEGVTSIENTAFYGLGYLKEVTIPYSVEAVANNAFVKNSNVIINCYYASMAKKYAIENNISYSLIRVDYDASGDGNIDVEDFNAIRNYLLSNSDISPDGDCNKDNCIDICDLVAFNNYSIEAELN